MKKALYILCIYLCLPFLSPAQTNDYQKSVEKLIEVSGAGHTLQSTAPRLLSMLKQQSLGIPDIFWETVEKELLQNANKELAVMMVPVYRKYLTQEELDKIIEFYETPIGRKLAEVSPHISDEMLTIGQQWGMQFSQRILQQLKDQGYL